MVLDKAGRELLGSCGLLRGRGGEREEREREGMQDATQKRGIIHHRKRREGRKTKD